MSVTIRGTDNSASTPAVTGTDGDTGVYFPAANQLALATNGTQALIVNSSQRVNIGTGSDEAYAALKVQNGLGAAVNPPWENSVLTVKGNAAAAQGVGGLISLEGNYITGDTASSANLAWIKAAKTNGTSGSATGDLILGARSGNIRITNDTSNSGLASELLRISPTAAVEYANYNNSSLNTGEVTITWGNVSSTTFDVTTLFPDVIGTGSNLGIILHVSTWTGGAATATSAIVNGARGSSSWSWSTVNNTNTGGGTTVSVSGSGNVVTISFSFGAQYGKARIRLLATA
jgi:hypothetical protein